jgi:GH24 family phage-related lysozyme (muramidase)
MKISQKGIDLIKKFEGCRLDSYKCSAGKWTIGYGHTAGVTAGQKISQAQAEAYLRADLEKFEKLVAKYDNVYRWTQNEFDALVSFAYNTGSIDKLTVNGKRTKAEVSEKILLYVKDGNGNVLQGLVNRRKAEQELFLKAPSAGEVPASKPSGISKVLIGSARQDENGRYAGGAAGDQTGKEVSTQEFYKHSKGWYVLRAKSAEVAAKLASAMQAACDNQNIGYDQGQRLDIIIQLRKYGSLGGITVKTEADCSSLVRACCIEAGFDPGNFTTSDEVAALAGTGYFEPKASVASAAQLREGDILVTKTKGHTVIVVYTGSSMSRQTIRRGSKGADVLYLQKRLVAKGYYVGEIDSDFGKQTENAVKAYQDEHGLVTDGIVGAKTWASLEK